MDAHLNILLQVEPEQGQEDVEGSCLLEQPQSGHLVLSGHVTKDETDPHYHVLKEEGSIDNHMVSVNCMYIYFQDTWKSIKNFLFPVEKLIHAVNLSKRIFLVFCSKSLSGTCQISVLVI